MVKKRLLIMMQLERNIDEFAKMVSDDNLSADQIYNADETALYWTITLPLYHSTPVMFYLYIKQKNLR